MVPCSNQPFQLPEFCSLPWLQSLHNGPSQGQSLSCPIGEGTELHELPTGMAKANSRDYSPFPETFLHWTWPNCALYHGYSASPTQLGELIIKVDFNVHPYPYWEISKARPSLYQLPTPSQSLNSFKAHALLHNTGLHIAKMQSPAKGRGMGMAPQRRAWVVSVQRLWSQEGYQEKEKRPWVMGAGRQPSTLLNALISDSTVSLAN